MKIKLLIACLLAVFLINFSSCVVRTPYDRQYWHKGKPHAMLRRPGRVMAHAVVTVWHPFGVSSFRGVREHWPRHHGARIARVRIWPRMYVPHSHLYRSRFRNYRRRVG